MGLPISFPSNPQSLHSSDCPFSGPSPPPSMYSLILEPGSYYVAQAGFEPLGSGYPAMSVSQTAVTAGRCHCTWPG